MISDYDALEVKRLKDEYQTVCSLVARMHEAAVGYIGAPQLGMVEDIADLKEHLDIVLKVNKAWKTRCFKAETERGVMIEEYDKVKAKLAEYENAEVVAWETYKGGLLLDGDPKILLHDSAVPLIRKPEVTK
jgi:hypothetical protein